MNLLSTRKSSLLRFESGHKSDNPQTEALPSDLALSENAACSTFIMFFNGDRNGCKTFLNACNNGLINSHPLFLGFGAKKLIWMKAREYQTV